MIWTGHTLMPRIDRWCDGEHLASADHEIVRVARKPALRAGCSRAVGSSALRLSQASSRGMLCQASSSRQCDRAKRVTRELAVRIRGGETAGVRRPPPIAVDRPGGSSRCLIFRQVVRCRSSGDRRGELLLAGGRGCRSGAGSRHRLTGRARPGRTGGIAGLQRCLMLRIPGDAGSCCHRRRGWAGAAGHRQLRAARRVTESCALGLSLWGCWREKDMPADGTMLRQRTGRPGSSSCHPWRQARSALGYS
jgi:hypothetical protein